MLPTQPKFKQLIPQKKILKIEGGCKSMPWSQAVNSDLTDGVHNLQCFPLLKEKRRRHPRCIKVSYRIKALWPESGKQSVSTHVSTCSTHQNHRSLQKSLSGRSWDRSYKSAIVKGNIYNHRAYTTATYTKCCYPTLYYPCESRCQVPPCPSLRSSPCSALKPCRGTREDPVTNWSSRARRSSSKNSTAFQNHLTTLLSGVQCFNRVLTFQSLTSILPSPQIMSCWNLQEWSAVDNKVLWDLQWGYPQMAHTTWKSFQSVPNQPPCCRFCVCQGSQVCTTWPWGCLSITAIDSHKIKQFQNRILKF